MFQKLIETQSLPQIPIGTHGIIYMIRKAAAHINLCCWTVKMTLLLIF